jgi:hypothetical protein
MWLRTAAVLGASMLVVSAMPGCGESEPSDARNVRCVLDGATCSCGDPYRNGGVAGEAIPTCADQVPAPRRCCQNESGCWCDPFTCYGGGSTNVCVCGFGNRKSTDIECITTATGIAENKAFASGNHCCAFPQDNRGYCECNPNTCPSMTTEVERCNVDTVDPTCPFDAVLVDSCGP